MKADKIVIVGGGSAGWMTAASMIKCFPNRDISVIESPDVPTVGVGESTLGQLMKWVNFIGLDEEDFFPFTDATYKFSIKFTDFKKKGAGSFHYPFGGPESGKNDPENAMMNWHALREYHDEWGDADMVEYLFPVAALMKHNKMNENRDGKLDNFNFDRDKAYHFDAAKFGLWLRERYCLPRGVRHIPKHVDKINTDENGVKELVMSDGEVITADLYIDCTGFRSMLLGGALEEPFVSYHDILPNDSAWATQIPYADKYKELEAYTNCTAIENGWVWNIPLWSRIGTGYVFSSKFVSDEQALEEFKNHLCSDNMTVPRTREEVDGYTYRKINMRVGVHERIFVKNVVAIGLSAGFIEPLESNGLYSVHEFLFALMDVMQREHITGFDKKWFNIECRDLFEGFAKFVAIHYAMSQRDDTEYWKANMAREYTETRGGSTIYDPSLPRIGTFFGAQRAFYDAMKGELYKIDGVSYISTGMGYRPVGGPRKVELEYQVGSEEELLKSLNNIYDLWTLRKAGWEDVAAQSPHMVDYMKRRFHNE